MSDRPIVYEGHHIVTNFQDDMPLATWGAQGDTGWQEAFFQVADNAAIRLDDQRLVVESDMEGDILDVMGQPAMLVEVDYQKGVEEWYGQPILRGNNTTHMTMRILAAGTLVQMVDAAADLGLDVSELDEVDLATVVLAAPSRKMGGYRGKAGGRPKKRKESDDMGYREVTVYGTQEEKDFILAHTPTDARERMEWMLDIVEREFGKRRPKT